MSDIKKMKEKRCTFCGKRIIDEKIPICLRYKLEGRNTVGRVGKVAGVVALAIKGGVELMNSSKKDEA